MTDKAHAKYGASASERWLACPGSVKLSINAPAQPESQYAEEGTKAHACFEAFMTSGGEFLKTQKALLKNHSKEMVAHAADAYHFVMDEAKKFPGAEVLCETKVDLSFVKEDEFGTVDAAIVELYGTLTVIDFKYGAGILVDPTENSQLIYYALGIAHKYDYEFSKVRIVILQPRAYADDGSTVRIWETDIATLEMWRETFTKGIEACEADEPPLVTGDHCRFCKAITICPELSSKKLREAQVDFDFRDCAPLPRITPVAPQRLENLSATLEALPYIEKWIEAVRAHALHLLEQGHEVPRFKLVPKRSTRQWIDEEKVSAEARKQFGDKAFTKPQLLSPAQLEKAIKDKEWVASNVTRVSSGHTMVSDKDPRPSVSPAKDDFEAIGDPLGDDFDSLPDALPPKQKKLPKHFLAFKQ